MAASLCSLKGRCGAPFFTDSQSLQLPASNLIETDLQSSSRPTCLIDFLVDLLEKDELSAEPFLLQPHYALQTVTFDNQTATFLVLDVATSSNKSLKQLPKFTNGTCAMKTTCVDCAQLYKEDAGQVSL